MAQSAVTVRVSTTDEGEMRRIQARLEPHGFKLRRMLAPLGAMTGDVETDRIDALRGVDGVEAVEAEGGVQLPPLDPRRPQ